MKNIYEKIAIGTAQFGLDYGISNSSGKTTYNEVEKILKHAKRVGIRLLDTAREYGDSEQTIGQIVSKYNNKQFFDVVTKVSKDANIDSDTKKSLHMLSTKKVYGLLIHNTSVLFDANGKEIYRDLENKKYNGSVGKIGVSVYTPEETERILNNFDIDIIQIPSSILDQRFINSGMIERLKEQEVEIHVRSIFLQGLYFMSPNDIPEHFGPIKDKLIQIDNTAHELGVSKTKFVVDYAKSLGVDKIVVGVNNLEQLMEIVSGYAYEDVDVDFKRFSLDDKLIDPRSWEVR